MPPFNKIPKEIYPAARHAANYACTLANLALKSGQIRKPAVCEECGCGATSANGLHGHHDDYLKPLSVRWLCGKCHSRFHKTVRVQPSEVAAREIQRRSEEAMAAGDSEKMAELLPFLHRDHPIRVKAYIIQIERNVARREGREALAKAAILGRRVKRLEDRLWKLGVRPYGKRPWRMKASA